MVGGIGWEERTEAVAGAPLLPVLSAALVLFSDLDFFGFFSFFAAASELRAFCRKPKNFRCSGLGLMSFGEADGDLMAAVGVTATDDLNLGFK